MCGIGGIACNHADPETVRRSLAAMESALAHRGPDDGGTEVLNGPWGPVGLCARRLAIQDISSRGHQPMTSPRSGSWVCLNGEIYNAKELRTELAGRHHRFRGHSDTEVVLAAYDEWGPGCFSRLRGMFAIAILNAKGGRLVLARDRLGIKPLYYSNRPLELLFASEVRALLASGMVPRTLSTSGVASYLALGAVAEPETVMAGIYMLPPGHYGTWDGATLQLASYWSLADAFEHPKPVARQEPVAQLRVLLEDAVRRHLLSDVPVGVFLSGGIDSSTLVGLVASVAEEPPQTVSVVFPQQQYSEERYIRLVADRFSTKHTQIMLDEAEALRQVPRALSAMDQPTFDGVNTFIVSGQARGAGLTVALTGLGSDELFVGYDTFQIALRLQRLRRLIPSPARPLAAILVRRRMHDNDRGRKLARWVGGKEQALTAAGLRREVFGPDAVADLLAFCPLHLSDNPTPLSVPDEINQVSHLELAHYMGNVLLRDADVLSMAHGLELRVPFLDHEIVEFVAGLPGYRKAQGATPKPLLVEAVADLLPPAIVNRPKMGFTLPFTTWLNGVLRTQMESALLDTEFGGPLGELLDHVAIRNIWTRFLEGKTEWVRPWAIYVLKAWAEEHLTTTSTTKPTP
jgi:asparagine synthase (glutamine-hydrolysing)